MEQYFPKCRDDAARTAWANEVFAKFVAARGTQSDQPFRSTWWPDADLNAGLFLYDAQLAEERWKLQRKRIERDLRSA